MKKRSGSTRKAWDPVLAQKLKDLLDYLDTMEAPPDAWEYIRKEIEKATPLRPDDQASKGNNKA